MYIVIFKFFIMSISENMLNKPILSTAVDGAGSDHCGQDQASMCSLSGVEPRLCAGSKRVNDES